ncbi:mechanosensitive ion channel [Verrucomicrobiaceae bacterium 5K15]|uniref:Mechanosensing system component YbdG n=1 Tax=Oceaniferula flava TaxID=2800421 RepID=A0AAE2VCW6_9BACT|nr:mechanosensitive ion channel domain-containing protein [Oceaniferula flavus]MBK1856110.1 mechanosensitive ion channel [Oceaniferula flavus]MBM1137417.1 mechanosensitive ion channel [Oceaniferula flavus]
MQSWHDKLTNLLSGDAVKADVNWMLRVLVDLILLAAVFVVAYLAYLVIRKVLMRIVTKVLKKTANSWDDEILNSRLSSWISMLIPAAIILRAAPLAINALDEGSLQVSHLIVISAQVFIIILSLLSFNSVLNIIERIYLRFEVSKELPIKGFIQVIKIILIVAAIIFIISSLIGKSPVLIFSGLGAMTAVMMLIFKDSILGLVAGIQLSANRMVARGDWIEMNKFGADGEVLEVALTTVKVRNWDKTITTIPTYALISDSFKNWRGMSNSGVRRIKRSVNLDMSTVTLLDDAMLEKMRNIRLLQPYLDRKQKELAEWNSEHASDDFTSPVNSRALTNLGTFRAYMLEYLKKHPKIAQRQTLLVRQLQPTAHGVPIELYTFTNDNAWAHYEDIQSDIFEHFLAVLPEFGLRAFQSPSDGSMSALTSSLVD